MGLFDTDKVLPRHTSDHLSRHGAPLGEECGIPDPTPGLGLGAHYCVSVDRIEGQVGRGVGCIQLGGVVDLSSYR